MAITSSIWQTLLEFWRRSKRSPGRMDAAKDTAGTGFYSSGEKQFLWMGGESLKNQFRMMLGFELDFIQSGCVTKRISQVLEHRARDFYRLCARP